MQKPPRAKKGEETDASKENRWQTFKNLFNTRFNLFKPA